jgi:hypothetical protein
MIAAKIIMLRMTLHSLKDPRYHHVSRKIATNSGGRACHFGEKDERSVNGTPYLAPLAGRGRIALAIRVRGYRSHITVRDRG